MQSYLIADCRLRIAELGPPHRGIGSGLSPVQFGFEQNNDEDDLAQKVLK